MILLNKLKEFVWDQRNLQIKRIFAVTQDAADKVVVTYDAVQRKTSQLDQKGDLIVYQFDMANRLLQRQYPDSLNDVFSYDSASRLTLAISNRYQNTVSRSYNDDSTVATEGIITNSQNFQISHLFDSAKRKYQTAYPNGKILSQAFTLRNQLASVAYDSQSIANFQYDAGMRETTRGLGNGLTQTTAYRTDNLILQKAVAGVTNFSYTYDSNKRKLTETDGTVSSLSQTFSYDFEDRLTSWSSNGSTLNTSQSWNLSLEGAWLSNTVNNVAENRTFNQAYEILSSNANAMLHDRKGNLTKNKDGSIYTFDLDNQMNSSINATNISASYSYDALGRRVSKTSNNTTTLFVNSGYQILTEYSSKSNAPFAEVQSFIYVAYIDDPIALINNNGKYFYHSNNQFSVGAITDSIGNLTERIGYNAYGKSVTILDSVLVNNEYYFTGRQLDTETGMFYFRARYYDANLGQFISRDPVGYIDGMNLYCGYFAINYLDPNGEWLFGAIVGAAIGAAAGALSGGGWKAVIAGAVGGAIGGAIMNPKVAAVAIKAVAAALGGGAATTIAASAAVGTVVGAVSSAASGVAAELIDVYDGGSFCWGDVGNSVIIGTITGGALVGLGGVASATQNAVRGVMGFDYMLATNIFTPENSCGSKKSSSSETSSNQQKGNGARNQGANNNQNNNGNNQQNNNSNQSNNNQQNNSSGC